jgi:hypothetical protein
MNAAVKLLGGAGHYLVIRAFQAGPAAIIIASGIYIAFRERQRRAAAA